LERLDTTETLASVLSPAAVDMTDLHRRYGDLQELVRRLIGVVPNCDPLLEIWPTAFRTYNLLVPNFLNLPALLFGGGAPKEIVGLAMYVASRAAECAYCAAHTCSFALRRGTTAEKIAAAYGSTFDESRYSAAEQAVIASAERLAQIPSAFTAADRSRLEQHFTSAQAAWLALAVAMLGFLNKFMDVLGVPLEEQTSGEVVPVIGASGWVPGKHGTDAMTEVTPPRADTIWTTLGVLRHAPQAVMLDRRWTSGVPATWPAVGAYLREQTGHDFPILGRVQHARPRRALATMLRDNLAAPDSKVGLQAKTLAGLVYATVVQDAELAAEARRLVKNSGVPEASLSAVAEFAATPVLFDADSDADASELALRSDQRIDEAWLDALLIAKAASVSPAQMTAPSVTRASARLSPQALIELLTWISIQQLLHRLGAFFA
jgi:alkylhydroperoxidase family enzyme